MSENISSQIESLKKKLLDSKEALLKHSLIQRRKKPSNGNQTSITEVSSENSIKDEIETKRKANDDEVLTIMFIETFNTRMKAFSDEMNGKYRTLCRGYENAIYRESSAEHEVCYERSSSSLNVLTAASSMDAMEAAVRHTDTNADSHHMTENLPYSVQDQHVALDPMLDNNNQDDNQLDGLSSKLMTTKESLLKNLLKLKKRKREAASNNNCTSIISEKPPKKRCPRKKKHKSSSNKYQLKADSGSQSCNIPVASVSSTSSNTDMTSTLSTSSPTIQPSALSDHHSTEDKISILKSKLMQCKEIALRNALAQKLKHTSNPESQASSSQASDKRISTRLKGWAQNQLIHKQAMALSSSASFSSSQSKHHTSDKKFISKLLEIVRQQKLALKSQTISSSSSLSSSPSKPMKPASKKSKPVPCLFFMRYGKCRDLDACHYLHDPSIIRICPIFLNNSSCDDHECLLCHEEDPGKLPDCKYHLQGSCTRERCRYRHKEFLPDTPPCLAFRQGRCIVGLDCSCKHEYAKERAKTLPTSTNTTQHKDMKPGTNITDDVDSKDRKDVINDDHDEEEEDGLYEWVVDKSSAAEALYLPLPADNYSDMDNIPDADNLALFKRYYG